MFARGDGTDARVFAEKLRAVETCDLDRFGRCEACLNQQLYLAQVAEARNDAAVASWIKARDQ